MQKQIGSTLYQVTIHFSETSTETMDDKILRLIRNEALNGKVSDFENFSENIETGAAKARRLWYNDDATNESAA